MSEAGFTCDVACPECGDWGPHPLVTEPDALMFDVQCVDCGTTFAVDNTDFDSGVGRG